MCDQTTARNWKRKRWDEKPRTVSQRMLEVWCTASSLGLSLPRGLQMSPRCSHVADESVKFRYGEHVKVIQLKMSPAGSVNMVS